jgi:hypothetical protein
MGWERGEMNHLTEEQIVLHYYKDAEDTPEIERHLAGCPECRAELARMHAMLTGIGPAEVPEPPAGFEEKIWLNLRDRLPEKRSGFFWQLFAPRRASAMPRGWAWWNEKWVFAGVMALLLIGAFLAGRFWPRPEQAVAHNPQTATPQPEKVNPQRVMLVAVGDHLERSQMLLVEIMNADARGPVNLSSEQAEARNLLDSNHLYRLSAQQAGDPQVERVLDELGRVLAEIANGPAEISPGDLRQVRHTIQSEGLLFKVRVIGSTVNSKVRRPEQLAGGSVNQRL